MLSIGYATALLGVLCGAPAAMAIGATVALWLGVWEGLQYLRDRGAGHRVRRRWDWAADGACYALGSAGAVWFSGDPWFWGAFCMAALVMAGGLGIAFGGGSETANQEDGS